MSEERLATVNTLIAECAVLRKRRQFEKADTMREVLKSRYGVFVVDETMEWYTREPSSSASAKLDKGFNQWKLEDFVRSASDFSVLDPRTEAKILHLLSLRCDARNQRDFDRSNELRSELAEKFSVEVLVGLLFSSSVRKHVLLSFIELTKTCFATQDKIKEWRADGKTFKRTNGSTGSGYSRSPDCKGNLVEKGVDSTEVERLLKDRSEAKVRKHIFYILFEVRKMTA